MASDLREQQQTLASSDYDLRITNLARFIYHKLPIKSGSLIDIGAGNGLLLKFFRNHGFQIEGIELERSQVHQMKMDRKLHDVVIRQGDITAITGSGTFDVVIASDVIEHIEDDVHALQNLLTFVKVGGYLVITVPACSYLYGKRDKKWGHYRRYDASTLRNRFANFAFVTVCSLSKWNLPGFFAYFLYEKIFQKPINERLRYSDSVFSRLTRSILDAELRFETLLGGLPVGLTLIAIVRKNKVV